MTKNIINITLEKNGLDVIMRLKIDPEIENFFKQAGNSQFETSAVWLDEAGTGLKFYKKSEAVAGKVQGFDAIDNFGSMLSDDGRINVALLRTVGASEGITIKTEDLLSYEEMKSYIEDLAVWTRGFYESVLRPAGINATIGFEV
jgi:hypothetical protein